MSKALDLLPPLRHIQWLWWAHDPVSILIGLSDNMQTTTTTRKKNSMPWHIQQREKRREGDREEAFRQQQQANLQATLLLEYQSTLHDEPENDENKDMTRNSARSKLARKLACGAYQGQSIRFVCSHWSSSNRRRWHKVVWGCCC